MARYWKDKRGYALVVVLLVMFILTILGTALLYLGTSDNRLVKMQQEELNAYYVARSAADAMAAHLYDSLDAEDDRASISTLVNKFSPATSTEDVTIGGANYQYTVTTVLLPAPSYDLELIATANATNGTASETVKLRLRYSKGMFDHAIFTDGDIDLSLNTGQDVTIYGDIGTNGTGDIVVGKKSIVNGNLYYGTGGDPSDITNQGTVNGEVLELGDSIPFPAIDEDGFPSDSYEDLPDDLVITEEHYYEDIRLNGNDVLTFDDSSSVYYLRTDELDIGGNAEIIVPAGVDVHIYVADTLALGGTSFMTSASGGHLYLYYAGTDDVELDGSPEFQGMIYAPDACVDYSGGGTGSIVGSIIAKSFTGSTANGVTITYDESLDLKQLAISNYAPTYVKQLWSN